MFKKIREYAPIIVVLIILYWVIFGIYKLVKYVIEKIRRNKEKKEIMERLDKESLYGVKVYRVLQSMGIKDVDLLECGKRIEDIYQWFNLVKDRDIEKNLSLRKWLDMKDNEKVTVLKVIHTNLVVEEVGKRYRMRSEVLEKQGIKDINEYMNYLFKEGELEEISKKWFDYVFYQSRLSSDKLENKIKRFYEEHLEDSEEVKNKINFVYKSLEEIKV